MFRYCMISVLLLTLVGCSRYGRRVEGTVESPEYQFYRVSTIGFVPDYDEELMHGLGSENLLFDQIFTCFRTSLDPLGYETVPLAPAYELDFSDPWFEEDPIGYPDLVLYVTVEIRTREVELGIIDSTADRVDEFGVFHVESSCSGPEFVSATKTKRIKEKEKPVETPPEPEPPPKSTQPDKPVNDRPALPKQAVPESPPQDKQPPTSPPPTPSSTNPKVRLQFKDPEPAEPDPDIAEYPIVVGHHKTPSTSDPVPAPEPEPAPPPTREWVRGGYLRTGEYIPPTVYYETHIREVVIHCSVWAGPPEYRWLVWHGSVTDNPPAPLEFERVMDMVYALINGGHFPLKKYPQYDLSHKT